MATYGQLVQFGPYYSGGLLCTLKVYHYIAGTTTLKDVYTDRAKATTAAQPLLSDSNGVAFCYADGLYDMRIDASTDGVTYSTLYTKQNWAIADNGASLDGEGAALASASTLTLGTDGNRFHVTGTVATSILSGSQVEVTLIADAAWPLVHSASLILQNASNYTAVAGDVFKFFSEGAGVWREVSRFLAVVGVVTGISREIQGLAYSNGTDATNDINFAAGGCLDSTAVKWITCAAMAGKQLDVGWAAGASAGMRNSGVAIANGTYHLYAVAKADGTQDYYAHTSLTVATVITALQAESGGASYLYARRVGSILRESASIIPFTQDGDYIIRTSSVLNVDATNPGTSAVTAALSVPTGLKVMAMVNATAYGGTTVEVALYVSDLATTDAAASYTAAPLSSTGSSSSSSTSGPGSWMLVRTNTSAQVRYRMRVSGAADVVRIATLGWFDYRGNNL